MTGGILGLFRLRWSWWPHATRKPAHVGRIGPAIKPWCIVLHTTDMLPNTLESLVNSWTTRQGKGQCAHFLIGRNFAEGTIQFAPINRNANHAGGAPAHGWFVVGGKRVHPNTVSVGIEIHNAGQLRLIDGQWRSWDYDKKQPQGAAFAPEDVEINLRRPTRGWHRITEWQRTELASLLEALEGQLHKMPADVTIETNGPQIHSWATVRDCRIVGHVTLDPDRKTDPGPEIMREFGR